MNDRTYIDSLAGSDTVTWGEYVETSLLARYRDAGLRIFALRPIVQELRQQLGVPYPLAHLRPLVDEPTLALVHQLEDDNNLDSDLRVVVRLGDGQIMLAAPVLRFKNLADYGSPDDGT